jgi:hypothetical protein
MGALGGGKVGGRRRSRGTLRRTRTTGAAHRVAGSFGGHIGFDDRDVLGGIEDGREGLGGK